MNYQFNIFRRKFEVEWE